MFFVFEQTYAHFSLIKALFFHKLLYMRDKIKTKINSSDCLYATDMALEFTKGYKSKNITKTLKRTDVFVDDELSAKLNKAKGNYITIETYAVTKSKKDEFARISKELARVINALKSGGSCLVAALGNPDMTADALGKRTADKLLITRHLIGSDNASALLSCVCPNVLGVTGIESFDIIKGVVERIKPDCVIVIDSLAGASTSRIASAFQVTDGGITPGSGVSNHRMRFDSDTLGCKTIAIGVPLVVYASTIISDALNGNLETKLSEDMKNLVVTPKDVDLYVDDCAQIIAGAINLSYFGTAGGVPQMQL